MNKFPAQYCLPTIASVCLLASGAMAGPIFSDEKVEELDGVGITEHLNDQVPLDLQFVDEFGHDVTLSKYINGEKPVIITLNYYRCPMLCSLTLNGLVGGMQDLKWTVGNEFEIVTVSINPDEDEKLAMTNKEGYLGHYSRDGADKGWHFLTGEQENITTLADSLGFGYVFDKPTGEFLHTSSIIFLTPDGRISKYMNDVKFESQDLRFALVEASEGKIGSALDKILLFNCFQYDPDRNSYTPSAWKLMRTAAVLMIITLALGLAVLSYTTPDKLRHAHAGMDGNTA